MITYTIHVTDMQGNEASVTGSNACLDRIEQALFAAGARFDRNTECWDFGYYAKDADYDQQRGAHKG